MKMEDEKVNAVKNFPTPTTAKNVRQFLGLASYYRDFIPKLAEIATPLYRLTTKSAAHNFVWNDDADAAFRKLKSLLCEFPVLTAPDFKKHFYVQCDASDIGLGAALCQVGDDKLEHPVSFASRKLGESELNYSTVEKECLSVK